MSKSKMLSASATKEGGVDLAKGTILQKLPQKRSNRYCKQPVGLWNQFAAALKAEHMSEKAVARVIGILKS